MRASLLTTADAEAWERAMPVSRNVFASHGFARAQERSGEIEGRLLIDGNTVTPLLVRPVPDSPHRDAATPPFTGPIITGGGPGNAAGSAELLAAEGVVAEFDHVNPWDATADVGAKPDREIVWVDVARDAEELWRESYSKACRKNVKRSQREGVTVRVAESAADLAEFHRIYISTMERNDALQSYLFGESYFQAIFEELPDSARFALAEREGQVIAATLYLHDQENVYSFLGGADHAHQEVRPTNAVIHRTIEWAREAGKKRLVLGGGYQPDDGIFRFKASFSPLRATLELARRIHDQAAYDELVTAWRERGGTEDTGYFPLYRQPV
jgi:serine/alanine adding enzyme